MNSVTLAEHIPDINLITWQAERADSLFARLSPWTKLALLVLLVILVTVVRSPWWIALLYGAVLVLYAGSGLPVKKLLVWYIIPVLFVVSLVGILMWNEPGTPLVSIGLGGYGLTLTDNGLLLLGMLLAKALISVTFTLLVLMTTPYRHIAALASRIFPDPLDQIFLMAYRFLFLALEMVGSLLKSVQSRGGGFVRSIRMQGRMFAAVFALIFIRSFDRAERVAKAMQARGYSGKYAAGTEIPRMRCGEAVFLVIAATGVILAAAGQAGVF